MDHGDQFETEGRGMSEVRVGEVDLCDNLPNPKALTAQTRNLNETNTQSVPPSPNEEVGRCGFQKHSLNNNGKEEEVDQGKEGQARRSHEEDEEEDIDAVMREEEEEDESEESSCVIRCQSPETPMTDSSYSETGSLLETPYQFSPGTSPEPTSPVIPVISPETVYPISSVEMSQSDAEMDSHISSTGSGASTTGSFTCAQGPTITTGPTDSTLQTITSGMGPTSPGGPTCTTGATDGIAKNTVSSAEQLTSSTEPTFVSGSTSSYPGPTTSTESTRVNTSVASNPMSATTEPLTSTTGSTTTGTEPNSTTGLISSYTPVTTCFSAPTCTTGPILNTTLQECLGQLAQRGDDTHLPQYLHQVAEAFVRHEDYQRALWCIQLERLYHQRVLENLNALQQQWEGQCSGTSSELTTQHLDTLKHVCQTHSRPRTRDAECASLDFLRAKFEESGALASCTSVHQAEGGMENRAEDSASPSINLADRLNSPEILEKDREDPDGFTGSQLSDKQGSERGGEEAEGGVEHAISVIGNGLHPSTAGGMDQSTPAEQQGKDLGPAQEKEVKTEEGETAAEMEDEGDEEEEEEAEEEKRDSPFCQEALPVETLVSGAELEVQQLHRDALAQEKLHDEIQHCLKIQEAHPPQETHMKHQEEGEEEEEEEEEEEDYEVNQASIIREAPSLDDMAKLITVEEMSPASGLVSILKKRSICMDSVSVTSSEPQPQKATAKRRVRFKVPDDGYEQDVGGGDSCLLLFLLCLVTVVISVGGTALYCALGDAQSSVCQDFSRNADFYIGQIQRGVTQIQHWLTAWS